MTSTLNLLLSYPVNDEQVQRIARAVPQLEIIRAEQDELAGQLSECDLFCGHIKTPVDWEFVVNQGRLRWIQSSAAGIDHCLTPPVIQSDIVVSSCSGLFRDSVAEQAMALLYGVVRSLPLSFRARARRDFSRHPTGDLHGRTVGIVGFGGNGQRIAEVLKPVAGRIVATDRVAGLWRDEPGIPAIDQLWPASELERLLNESDVVIATAPLDATTTGMFGHREFSRMPRGSWFINVGRGGLVDEVALVDALDEGQLAGAGLDVTAIEPLPPESRLWDHPQVILTPHVGAQSAGRYQFVTDLLCDNLRRFVRGERLLNRVDKRLGFPLPADRPRVVR